MRGPNSKAKKEEEPERQEDSKPARRHLPPSQRYFSQTDTAGQISRCCFKIYRLVDEEVPHSHFTIQELVPQSWPALRNVGTGDNRTLKNKRSPIFYNKSRTRPPISPLHDCPCRAFIEFPNRERGSRCSP
eukprot:Gregarina_sp_Poly_1__2643@NODE_1720_length_3470_cov_120_882751_g1127_i0_p2_GENE_NODE_1720_length_3470_cov_120_882751_g1127_i0NODE_1720_length_3470_cov_120_882751_g1127_i0_p2_ORF_typecomplete_len131_score7_26K1377/PF15352_6/0_23_NODE_1720_length_3470_cov_120_882751_g1127_i030663458